MDGTRITIFTDGGADPNPGIGGWAAILVDEASGKHEEMSGGESATTNNRMELTAAIEALMSLEAQCEIDLYTDSTYLRQGVTRWLPGWREAGWRRKDGAWVKNVDLWQRLDDATKRHRIRWQWVKGHAGNKLNERADVLATAEIARRKGASDRNQARPAQALPEVPWKGGQIFLQVTRSPTGSAWAALIRDANGDEELVTRRGGEGSAQRIALEAACDLLAKISSHVRWQLLTSSDYLRRGVEEWMLRWKENGWSTADGSPVKNADLWQVLEARLRDVQVLFPAVQKGDCPELARLTKLAKQKRSQAC